MASLLRRSRVESSVRSFPPRRVSLRLPPYDDFPMTLLCESRFFSLLFLAFFSLLAFLHMSFFSVARAHRGGCEHVAATIPTKRKERDGRREKMVGGCVCSRIPRQSYEYYCLCLIRVIEFSLKCSIGISLLLLIGSRSQTPVSTTSRIFTSRGKSKVFKIHRYRFVCSWSSCFLCQKISFARVGQACRPSPNSSP